MIDNFEKIKKLLEFGEDTYYYVQIIQRRKDPGNESLGSSEFRRWAKFIGKPETLDTIKTEIQELCCFYHARAYIELNPRSLEKWSIEMAKRLLDRISLQDYNNVWSLPNKVALCDETIKTRGLTMGRRWMFDVDQKTDIPVVQGWLQNNGVAIESEVPTISGEHIIVRSFNYKNLDIKFEKDIKIGNTITHLSPCANTLLYV